MHSASQGRSTFGRLGTVSPRKAWSNRGTRATGGCGRRRSCALRRSGHLVPDLAVERSATCLGSPPSPLFVEERDVGGGALVTDLANPLRVDRACVWT